MKNKIYFLSLFLVCTSCMKLSAQCSMSVPNYVSGGNVATNTINISYVQTFKSTCSGVVTTIVFPNIYAGADDFRGSSYFVECRVRDNAGNIIGIAPRTDQWFPGATVTFSFACKNISLIQGNTYQFELKEFDWSQTASSSYGL